MSNPNVFESKWTGWVRQDNELVAQYTFVGALPREERVIVQLELTIKPGIIRFAPLHHFLNFFIQPQLKPSECDLFVSFQSSEDGESTGFLPALATPAQGNTTLLNVPSIENVSKVFGILSRGKDMILVVKDERKEIVRLQLSNDGGFYKLYKELTASLFEVLDRC